jgi:hypothetical protein
VPEVRGDDSALEGAFVVLELPKVARDELLGQGLDQVVNCAGGSRQGELDRACSDDLESTLGVMAGLVPIGAKIR